GPVALLDGEAGPSPDPRLVHGPAVPVREVAALVQHRQAHNVEDRRHVADLLHLQHPAGGHPRERAGGIAPEDNRCSHVAYATTPPTPRVRCGPPAGHPTPENRSLIDLPPSASERRALTPRKGTEPSPSGKIDH